MTEVFANRSEAGRLLARELLQRRWRTPVVLAVAPGGVPVGVEVALALRAPLDLVLVRRICAAHNPGRPVAAIAEGPGCEPVLDLEAMEATGTYRAHVEARSRAELAILAQRRTLFLGHRAPLALAGCTAIVVDDGLATGTTARAALKAVRARRPAQLVLAVPVASRLAAGTVAPDVDTLVCLAQPAATNPVGVYYADFHPLSDDELLATLARLRKSR